MQLTDKLQHLNMMLQPHSASSLVRHQYTKPCRHIQTPSVQHRESNLNTTMLQDIPTFDGQDSSKLEDWFTDIETTADILTVSYICLTEANSHSLTHMLIHEATQTVKCWDDIKGILRLNSLMPISILILHTLWRYNSRTRKSFCLYLLLQSNN